MLHNVDWIEPDDLPPGPWPRFLAPLAAALENHEPVDVVLADIVRGFGFAWFTYGTSSVPTPTRESRTYVWTNLPHDWVERYDEKAYIEVDPRVTESSASAMPMAWDRHTFRESKRRAEFFDDAARFGICSGIAVGLRDPARALSGFYLSSPRTRLDDETMARYAASHGDILVLAHYIHAVLTSMVVDRDLPAPTAGARLSPRERESLQLGAKGLSSIQIAAALGIGERTVHYHFANLLAKLGAANRHQAIARAVSLGLITP